MSLTLLEGNEAVAWGAYRAGMPGEHTVRVASFLQGIPLHRPQPY